jgi:hypothetical protein
MKLKKVYYAKTLFDGKVVGKDGGLYVGVPGGQQYSTKENFSSEKDFSVIYQGKKMVIPNWHRAEAFRKFDDRAGRGTYTLGYFLWKPLEEEYIFTKDGHAIPKEEPK